MFLLWDVLWVVYLNFDDDRNKFKNRNISSSYFAGIIRLATRKGSRNVTIYDDMHGKSKQAFNLESCIFYAPY